MAANLKKNIWESDQYYQTINTLEDFSHPGFKEAQQYSKLSHKILDVGCGDGSKLSRLGNDSSIRFGAEISKTAIELGKKKYPDIKFTLLNSACLPYKSNFFDLVTSFFVLEHTDDPEKLILEMIRVTKVGGLIILLAPNFGAPNRASPNGSSSRLQKLLSGFIKDFVPPQRLNWQTVTPQIHSIKEFRPDLDTTIEPYLGSLLPIAKKYGEVRQASSFWSMELPAATLLQKFFRILGEAGIYPFKYWGPHLFLILKKT